MTRKHSRFMCLICGVVILSAVCPRTIPADTAGASDDVLFERGNAAYDRGDYAEALRQYGELFSRDRYSIATLYNAANASFRNGSPGNAVLLYRRAWYLNPRDADILANMQLAIQRVGSLQPSVSLLDHAARELSHQEWTSVMKTAYWIALASFAAMVLVPAVRRFLKPVAVVSLAVSIVGLGGWTYWYKWQRSGEAVVIATGQTALYEPRDKATPFFETPEGSIVYIEDRFDSWVKVRAGDNTGWLRSSAVATVYPWKTARID